MSHVSCAGEGQVVRRQCVLSCPRCPVVQCVRHSGDDVCCSVAPVIVADASVFSVMWDESLMSSVTSRPLWSSVHECEIVECAFKSPVRIECGVYKCFHL